MVFLWFCGLVERVVFVGCGVDIFSVFSFYFLVILRVYYCAERLPVFCRVFNGVLVLFVDYWSMLCV